MAETWAAIPDFILDQVFGYQTATNMKERSFINAFRTHSIGGSRQSGFRSDVYLPCINYYEIELPGSDLAGMIIRARVDVKVENAATSVTPKIRNVTAVTDSVVGAASTSTTWASQTLTMVINAATEKYRLELLGSNKTWDIFGIAYIEILPPADV